MRIFFPSNLANFRKHKEWNENTLTQPGREVRYWKKLCTYYTMLTVLLNSRSYVGLNGGNKNETRRGRSEASLSSLGKYKAEMLISNSIQSVSTPKRDYPSFFL